ncbi:hypothetical protein L208DRAFT_1413190 [Tricholoma matsutake]|nr:hypothetical protein L208DRAFT_1413190 [Tricholoma matsutake 945]
MVQDGTLWCSERNDPEGKDFLELGYIPAIQWYILEVNRMIWRTTTHTHLLHTTSWWFIGHRSSSPGKTYGRSHMLLVTWLKYN